MDDNAVVRRVVAAADQVSACLAELGSSAEIETLLKSFQAFSEALLVLNRLTADRAKSLQDPRQAQQLLDYLETLRRCISMLHTAMCTTIKHPTCEQAQAAKRYILNKVQSSVRDITDTLRSDSNNGPLGPHGYYTGRRNSLLQLLSSYSVSSFQDGGFDSLVRDIVFHCMVVANSSRRAAQQRIVSFCRHILQFWSDIEWILKSSEEPADSAQRFEKTCALMVQQVQMLNKALVSALLYQVLDTFLTASLMVRELLDVTKRVLAAASAAVMDLTFIQPVVEGFISSTDRIIQVANFTSAVAEDARSLENVENSQACLRRLRAQVTPLSLELEDNEMRTVQMLHDLGQKWKEEMNELQEAISDVVDVREFTSLAITEMINDQRGCDEAYREQSYELFSEHTKRLMSCMKLAIRSVRRHLERSDNPIYRNGLLVLLKQACSSQSKATESIRGMLCGSALNVEMYATFTDNVSTIIQHFKVLREGLDGYQHPHLLSPLREGAREPEISPPLSAVEDTVGISLDNHVARDSNSPVLDVQGRNTPTKHDEEHPVTEPTEVGKAHKDDSSDLKVPAVQDEPELIHKPVAFDLLPLMYEVVTVTKEKNVSVLNQACTGVLELSNCYAQAARESLAIVDAVDGQTLESFRAELVSLTPLLVQTAQEMAMSSSMSSESIYKHCTQFSDLIGMIKKVLLPAAGTWYHAAYAELQGNLQATAPGVPHNLNAVMTLCAHTVQSLTSSDLNLQSDGQEMVSVLHSKLNKAQNNTRRLVEFCSLAGRRVDQLDSLCILWGLSIQVLLNSLDRILGTSTATVYRWNPQKQMLALSENSLRVQEAAMLTGLNCKSAHNSKQLAGEQEELKALTDEYLKAAEELDAMPSVMQLAKSEFLQRQLLIKIRVLSGLLRKANKDYDAAFQNVVSLAYVTAEHVRDSDADRWKQKFENTAQTLAENIKSASGSVDDCLNFIRDPRARSNLRSINDHLSFQISDIISRAGLVVETRFICDTLSLDVLIQCWAAKARYVVEEILKQDGIRKEVKESIVAGLQGRTPEDLDKTLGTIPKIKEVELSDADASSLQRGHTETIEAAETKVNIAAVAKYESKTVRRDVSVADDKNLQLGSCAGKSRSGFSLQDACDAYKEDSSLTFTSLFLKKKSNTWDPKDNRIVQVTRKMADTICHMTQYLKKRGPILVMATRGHFTIFVFIKQGGHVCSF